MTAGAVGAVERSAVEPSGLRCGRRQASHDQDRHAHRHQQATNVGHAILPPRHVRGWCPFGRRHPGRLQGPNHAGDAAHMGKGRTRRAPHEGNSCHQRKITPRLPCSGARLPVAVPRLPRSGILRPTPHVPSSESRLMTSLSRRELLGRIAAASAVTIVPRRVLGGRGYVAPSDMILLAQVGCGTQAQRQVNTGLVRRPDLQFVAVVDPNRDSQDYVDWSPLGTATPCASSSTTPTWGDGDTGIRAGREVAQVGDGDVLPEAGPTGGGHPRLRGLPRDAREGDRHPGRRQHHARPPARPHQHRGAPEGQGGDLAQAGRERAARGAADAAGGRARARRPRTCSPTATSPTGTRSRRGSRPA